MAIDDPTLTSLAAMLENVDFEIDKTKSSLQTAARQVRQYECDLSNQERTRGVVVAQLARLIDIAVHGAVKEIGEEVNRSGRE